MALTAFAEANRSTICWGDVYFESVDPQTGGIQPQMNGRGVQPRILDSHRMLGDRGGVQISQLAAHHELTYFTLLPENIDAFAQAVRNGHRMADMLEATGWYMARNGLDTVMMTREGPSYVVHVVLEQNAGNVVMIDNSVITQLSARGMAPIAGSTAKLVSVPGVGTGILFSSGDVEYISFTASRFEELLQTNTTYTIGHLVSVMEQNIELFTASGAVLCQGPCECL